MEEHVEGALTSLGRAPSCLRRCCTAALNSVSASADVMVDTGLSAVTMI